MGNDDITIKIDVKIPNPKIPPDMESSKQPDSKKSKPYEKDIFKRLIHLMARSLSWIV